MSNVTTLSSCEQTSFQDVSQAVSAQILADFRTHREDDGKSLSELLDAAILEGINRAFSVAAEAHASEVLGVERSVRAGSRAGYRSGTRTIRVGGPLGDMNIALVKSRKGLLRPEFMKNAVRFTAGVKQLAVRLWAHGLSCRSIEAVSQEALKSDIGRTSVGSWVQEAETEVLAWLDRPILADIRFLMLDGMYVSKKRVTTRCEPVLTIVGITDSGEKHVLGVMAAPNESFESWRTALQRLKRRGLDIGKLRMAVSDGCPGIIKALEVELPDVPRQRCTVHKTRNVLQNAAPAVKAAAAKEATAIWNAPNKSEARHRAATFEATWRPEHPHLANIIRDDFEATLTFYDMDASTWKSLRSTNVIERFNREMRRKFRDMGACRGDRPVVRVAGLVAMRLAKSWEGTVVRGFKTAVRRKHVS